MSFGTIAFITRRHELNTRRNLILIHNPVVQFGGDQRIALLGFRVISVRSEKNESGVGKRDGDSVEKIMDINNLRKRTV